MTMSREARADAELESGWQTSGKVSFRSEEEEVTSP